MVPTNASTPSTFGIFKFEEVSRTKTSVSSDAYTNKEKWWGGEISLM